MTVSPCQANGGKSFDWGKGEGVQITCEFPSRYRGRVPLHWRDSRVLFRGSAFGWIWNVVDATIFQQNPIGKKAHQKFSIFFLSPPLALFSLCVTLRLRICGPQKGNFAFPTPPLVFSACILPWSTFCIRKHSTLTRLFYFFSFRLFFFCRGDKGGNFRNGLFLQSAARRHPGTAGAESPTVLAPRTEVRELSRW